MPDLDLEDGDESLADASPSERRRRAREIADQAREVRNTRATGNTKTTSRSKGSRAAAAAEKEDVEVDSRLGRTFERIAKALEKRGDDELATVIREESGGMAQGLVSLTHNVRFLRPPLLLILNLIEPVMAFGRITGLLWGRWQERNARLAWEANAQPAEVVNEEVVQ
jgi:hypothetical protein